MEIPAHRGQREDAPWKNPHSCNQFETKRVLAGHRRALTVKYPDDDTGGVLQLVFNSVADQRMLMTDTEPATLVDLRDGQEGVVESLEMDTKVARRLMELGFLPGTSVVAARTAPGGDPRVFRVDGSEIALRRETACLIRLRRHPRPGNAQ